MSLCNYDNHTTHLCVHNSTAFHSRNVLHSTMPEVIVRAAISLPGISLSLVTCYARLFMCQVPA